jgi:hypothetical protein
VSVTFEENLEGKLASGKLAGLAMLSHYPLP